jgi:hypothetical protein
MSLKKVVTIAAAAGALAAISVPAMAFENEFHGSYGLQYFLSNYENGAGGNPLVTNTAETVTKAAVAPKYDPITGLVTAVGTPAVTSANPAYGTVAGINGDTSHKLKTNNYFEQRARLSYNAKVSDDLKLVTTFEIDSVFGDRAQGAIPNGTAYVGAFRNSGGAMETDAVNLETKDVYLDFKIPSTTTRVKAGIQNFNDSLKGIMFAVVDLAGIHTSTQIGAATLNAGYFRGYDSSFAATGAQTARPRGMDNLDIGVLEAKLALSKDVNLGAVYYLYADGRMVASDLTVAATPGTINNGLTASAATTLNVFGLTGDAKVGPVSLSGFLAYQFGLVKNINSQSSDYLNALALNLAAKAAVGPGTFRTAFLYTSGNNDGASKGASRHLTGWYGGQYTALSNTTGVPTMTVTAVNAYTESNMLLLNRALRTYGTTDMGIVYNAGNGTTINNQQGLY